MKKVLFPLVAVFFTAFFALTFNACVDKDFDEPLATIGVAPEGVVVNTTIAQLKAIGQWAEEEEGIVNITEDIIIAGSVTTSDEAGNFYKEIFIQDETGGLKISLDINDIFNDYKEGTKVYVKCQGLDLDKFSKMYTLGLGLTSAGYIGRIPPAVIPDHLFPGETNQFVTPNIVSIGDIVTNDDILGTLVTLEDVEFVEDQLGLTFAQDEETENRDLVDCNGSGMILRNSGYSDFWEETLPCGKGSITGIASRFLSDYQMFVSRSTDLDMTGDRCDGTVVTNCGPTGEEVQMSIADIRTLYTGVNASIPANTKIVGTVISDWVEANIVSRNVVIQDETGGITVRFSDDNNTLNLGDKVEVVVSNKEVSEFRGLLQIDGIANNFATILDFGSVTPVSLSIEDLLADFENYESTLVRVEGATLTGGGTYSGTLNLNDGTGSIDLFTWDEATFSGALAPTDGEDVSLVAIVSEYTPDGEPQGHQLMIRNLNDVTATGGGGGGDCDVDENFSSGTEDADINLSGWTNTAVEGTDRWIYGQYSGDTFAKIQGFGVSSSDLEGWLVTPEIDISTQKILSFNSIIGYPVSGHDPLTVYVSENFDGTNVGTATWVEISANIATSADISSGNFSDKVASGDISLPIGTTAHIAFVYEGDNTNNTTTIEVDDVEVCEE